MDAPGFVSGFPQPLWRGGVDVRGKTILVLEDEGFGDTIQFARYVPMLVARGARVVLRVGDPLQPLCRGCQALPVFAEIGSVPAVVRSALPGLQSPLAFETRLDTIPADMPYLPAPPRSRVQAWEGRLEDRLGPRRRFRVGLVWSGRPTHVNDHNRSIPLQMLSRILDVDAAFISLQKDPQPSDKAALERTGIVDLTSHLTDFAETAALVSCLDLVIASIPVSSTLPARSDGRSGRVALCAGLALAARSRRQPLVSDHAPVSADGRPGLG